MIGTNEWLAVISLVGWPKLVNAGLGSGDRKLTVWLTTRTTVTLSPRQLGEFVDSRERFLSNQLGSSVEATTEKLLSRSRSLQVSCVRVQSQQLARFY